VLEPLQRVCLTKFVRLIDHEASMVITNPLLPDNPIVYVTEPWQNMCGFTYAEAVGRNPRVTQGERTDPSVIQAMSGALSKRCSCKVQLVNYRSGLLDRPFWNVLSISPLMYRGEIQLFIANLQDYSYFMSKMVSLTPSQFCKVAESFQQQRHMESPVTERLLAKPAIYELDLEHVQSSASDKPVLRMTPPVKRLGWDKLLLEPEYLTDRVVDALTGIDAEYEVKWAQDCSGETAIVFARLGAVSFRVVVEEEPNGSYRITCSRLSGDTFSYHDAFRQLRQCLQDAVGSAEPAGSKGVGAKRRFEGADSAASGQLALRPRSNEATPVAGAMRPSIPLVPMRLPHLPLAPTTQPMDGERVTGAAAVREVQRDRPSLSAESAEGRCFSASLSAGVL
jgi:hypothetical protein